MAGFKYFTAARQFRLNLLNFYLGISPYSNNDFLIIATFDFQSPGRDSPGSSSGSAGSGSRHSSASLDSGRASGRMPHHHHAACHCGDLADRVRSMMAQGLPVSYFTVYDYIDELEVEIKLKSNLDHPLHECECSLSVYPIPHLKRLSFFMYLLVLVLETQALPT